MPAPLEGLIVAETDSPYLSPHPYRGKPNEPRQVSFVGMAVAEARGVPATSLAEQTSSNAANFFS